MSINSKLWILDSDLYVTINEQEIYKINKENLSREKVESIPKNTRENPITVIHKDQFDIGKMFFMNKNNPLRISMEMARDYRDIGLLSSDEFIAYCETFEIEALQNIEIADGTH